MTRGKVIIMCLILGLAIALIMFICLIVHTKTNKADEAKEPKRMVIVERLDGYRIIYDKYTKVMYSVSNGSYNRGTLTLLVDADGKPLLYTEEGEDE